jgi:hypothetical protein
MKMIALAIASRVSHHVALVARMTIRKYLPPRDPLA